MIFDASIVWSPMDAGISSGFSTFRDCLRRLMFEAAYLLPWRRLPLACFPFPLAWAVVSGSLGLVLVGSMVVVVVVVVVVVGVAVL